MIFPKEMSEIELIVPTRDLLPVTKILAGNGVFHQVEAGGIGGDKQNQRDDGWGDSAAAYAGLERRIQSLLQSLGIQGLPAQLGAAGDLLDLEHARSAVEGIERSVHAVVEHNAQLAKTLDTLRTHRKQLTAIADVELDVQSVQQSRLLCFRSWERCRRPTSAGFSPASREFRTFF